MGLPRAKVNSVLLGIAVPVIQCCGILLGVLLTHWFGKARHLASYTGGQKASGTARSMQV